MTGPRQGPVYRSWIRSVKSLPLLLLLLAVGWGNAAPVDEAARDHEALLERLNGLLGAGRPAAVLEELETLPDERWSSRIWNLRGLALASLQRHREAVSAYEAGLRAAPDRGELHLNLAVSLLELGATGRALAEFEAAVELEPESVDARLGLGRGLLRFGRLERAGEELQAALRLAPEDPRVLRGLADWSDGVADSALARRWWGRLEAITPDAATARRLAELARGSDPEAAIARYRDCLDRDPGATDCAEAAAGLLLGRGRVAEAIEILMPRAEEGGLSAASLRNLLIALREAGRDGDLEALIQRQPPRDGPSWGLVALARRQAGRSTEALEAVAEALRLQPDSPDLYNLQGVVLEELGRRPEARAAWRRALELRPGHPEAQANLDGHPPR